MTHKIVAEMTNQGSGFRREHGTISVWFETQEDETVFEQLVNRRNRPHKEYRKHMDKILEACGLPEGTRLRWSQKEICACGCSPAFLYNGWKDFSVRLSIKEV
jgi:hypothetical protein